MGKSTRRGAKSRSRKRTPPIPHIDLRNYDDGWVLLHPRTHRVLGHGATIREAEENAKVPKGVRPVLFSVAMVDRYVGWQPV
jgi:hypothetical protein